VERLLTDERVAVLTGRTGKERHRRAVQGSVVVRLLHVPRRPVLVDP
jgi:hypothetical protein